MKRIRNLTIYITFAICVTLLFAGKPGFYTARSSLYLWDLGHILLFTLTTIIILKDIKAFGRLSFFRQIVIIFIFSFVIGVATELIQVNFDRDPDVQDLIRDVLGALLAVAFFSPARANVSKLFRRSFQSVLVIITMIYVYPFMTALIDEVIAWKQFPVLADFETAFEASRWQDPAQVNISEELARNGDACLQVALSTRKYSGVSFNYFPNDWRSYKDFHFSVYNPDADTLRMECRVHDKWHNHNYADRFNLTILVRNGWNDFTIPIADIETAPKERKMDLERVEGFVIFTVQSPRNRTIYLDHLYLDR